ncbi:hypothetical protein KJ708_03100, partial [bacterium]|nr:hypothetical protein [bacterium]
MTKNAHMTPPRHLKIINFEEKALEKKQKLGPTFEDLATKLEKRICDIEKTVKDGMHLLEDDVKKLSKKQGTHISSQEFQDEINRFTKHLEERLNKTITDLQAETTTPLTKEEFTYVKGLTNQLSNILSFDFYKNVLASSHTILNKQEVDEFGMDPMMVEKVKPLFDFLYYKYWRVKTTGIHNIPNQGRGLLVGNHSG